MMYCECMRFVFFQAEDGIRDLVRSRGLGDVYKRQMFCIASIWKMYSLPERRAGSPVQFSDGPRMAKSLSLIHI